jgi:hypothetical protein
MFKEGLKFFGSVMLALIAYNIILKPILGTTVSSLVGF